MGIFSVKEESKDRTKDWSTDGSERNENIITPFSPQVDSQISVNLVCPRVEDVGLKESSRVLAYRRSPLDSLTI